MRQVEFAEKLKSDVIKSKNVEMEISTGFFERAVKQQAAGQVKRVEKRAKNLFHPVKIYSWFR